MACHGGNSIAIQGNGNTVFKTLPEPQQQFLIDPVNKCKRDFSSTIPNSTTIGTTAKRLVSRESDTWPRDAAIAALLAYCAVYCLNTAYGRLCLGVAGASASRYTPYVVLGLFGLYLYALSNPWRNLRIALVLVLLAFAMLGTRPLNPPDAWELKYLSDRKNVWRECYLTRHDIDECDALTHFQIDPSPEATRLQEKLDFLERDHLNLYDNSQ